jgi:excisionase family DNA binding protein
MAELNMSITETSKRTGWSKDLIYSMIRNHQIPFVRAGNRKLSIPKETFEKWLAETALSNLQSAPKEPLLIQAARVPSQMQWKPKPGCGRKHRKEAV